MHPNPFIRVALPALAVLLAVTALAAERRATPAEAVQMVRKAVATIRKDGGARTYASITDRHGPFVARDLYVTVWGLDGTVRAHGLNPNMVGKNLLDLRDIDGKPFIRERMHTARTQASFWQDYQYTHPMSKRIEPKRMYCERLDDSVVCGGIYP
jgi:cytochrome c